MLLWKSFEKLKVIWWSFSWQKIQHRTLRGKLPWFFFSIWCDLYIFTLYTFRNTYENKIIDVSLILTVTIQWTSAFKPNSDSWAALHKAASVLLCFTILFNRRPFYCPLSFDECCKKSFLHYGLCRSRIWCLWYWEFNKSTLIYSKWLWLFGYRYCTSQEEEMTGKNWASNTINYVTLESELIA